MLKLNYSNAKQFVNEDFYEKIKEKALSGKATLLNRTGEGNDALGWIDWPADDHSEMLDHIKNAAERIKRQSEILIVIGIGGSYLGAAAAIDFLKPYFYNQCDADTRRGVEVYFAGNHISGAYLKDLINLVKDRDFSVNIISKSGTTTEPAIAFRIFKKLLEEKHGKAEAVKRVYATTDREKGALKQEADVEGYTTFEIPEDIGGRYSVLTPVGLLPIAAIGGDIDALIEGAAAMREQLISAEPEEDIAMQYAILRHCFYDQGKRVELFSTYEPKCRMIAEWWKQLFGESEGKGRKGLFPAAYGCTTDLHSLGQFVQDGSPILFETVLNVADESSGIIVQNDETNLDHLNYLAGKSLEEINHKAMQGSIAAHIDGEVPVLSITLDVFGESELGALFYFFEFACGISGYMFGVNPFDQPGVEAYKRNMFRLLGKPGYEAVPEESKTTDFK